MTQARRRWPTRMNPTDALFWTMDRVPELRSTIAALLILEGPTTRARLRREFERLSRLFARMRQHVVEVPFGLAPPEWVDDSQFDLDYHLRYLAVPAPGGRDELLAELAPLYATALDRDRPLWEAYVAEGLADGRSAVFLKLHHCMVDGVGGARLFQDLLGTGASRPPDGAAHRAAPRSTDPAALVGRALLYNLRAGGQVAAEVVRGLREVGRHPLATGNLMERELRRLAGLNRQLFVPRARSPLRAARSLSRRLATFEMSLADIDAVRTPLGATINDVVLTVVSGAMHRWHQAHGTDVRELRALVPVNLRAADESEHGNRIAMLTITLPIGEPDPLRRLRIIQERVGQVKGDRRATLYPLVAGAVFRLPLPLAEVIARQQTASANFVCTNVPGPRHTYRFAGIRIMQIYPFTPLVGDHPIAIALLSYRRVLYVGLDVDPLGMQDIARFRKALEQAYAEVLALRHPGRAKPMPGRRSPLRAANGSRPNAPTHNRGGHPAVPA